MATARKNRKLPEPTYPKIVEMFAEPNLTNHWPEPDCFNGIVHYRRHRITVELVEEPEEVLHARLITLWRNCDNHHSWIPLKNAAAQHGLDLKSEDFGKDRKRK